MNLKKTIHTSSRELLEVYNPDLASPSRKRLMAKKESYLASPTRIDKVKLSNDFEKRESSLKPKKRGSKLNVKNEEKIRQLKNVGSSELM